MRCAAARWSQVFDCAARKNLPGECSCGTNDVGDGMCGKYGVFNCTWNEVVAPHASVTLPSTIHTEPPSTA